MKRVRDTRSKILADWRFIVDGLVAVLLMVVLVREWPHIRSSLALVGQARLIPVLVALGFVVVTFLLAAFIYCILALRPLRYGRTLAVELGAACANRLLPAGVGGLGLHGWYLHRQRHSAAEATVVVAANNILGIVGHVCLLAIVLIWLPDSRRALHIHAGWQQLLWIGGGVVIVIVLLSIWPAMRHRLIGFAREIRRVLGRYTALRYKVVAVLPLTMLMTLVYVTVLFVCERAMGGAVPYGATFMVFTVGMLASTITPTPGGLVGAEAGLFAGLSAYGVAAVPALAIVVLYRLLTYWLPLLPGALALLLLRRFRVI